MFEFDDQAVYYDVTAVENQFILQYMPAASGAQVKVYLYGLMMCRSPRQTAGVEQIAQELNLTEEEVLSAFRHWEFCGLVHRVSDKPPVFRYTTLAARMARGENQLADQDYVRFIEQVHAVFDHRRALHTRELSMAWEWVTEMRMPEEVVLLTLNCLRETRGMDFSFKQAQKLMVEMAEDDIRTEEKAESYLGESREMIRGCRAVLKELGKRRPPSEPEMRQYKEWLDQGFTQEVILAACEETRSGEPTFKYLGGILNGMRSRGLKAGASAADMRAQQAAEAEERRGVAALIRTMNLRDVSVNTSTIRAYQLMREICPDEDVIQLAGRECARTGGRLDDVLTMLESWRARGLKDREAAEAYVAAFNSANDFLRALKSDWGDKTRVTHSDRELLQKWRGEWGFPDEMIRWCAAHWDRADKPMPYLDRILAGFHEKGIRDPAAAEEELRKRGPETPGRAQAAKTVTAQQYPQRTYSDDSGYEMPDWMKKRLEADEHAQ